jgi:hypothetical protein
VSEPDDGTAMLEMWINGIDTIDNARWKEPLSFVSASTNKGLEKIEFSRPELMQAAITGRFVK